jgi:hypothetical protein
MSNKPLTEEQKQHIRQGVLRFYDTPAGIEKKKSMLGRVPWNRGTGKPKPSKRIIPEVDQFTKEGVFIRRWKSIAEAATELNTCFQGIWYVATGKRKSAGGFIWRFSG